MDLATFDWYGYGTDPQPFLGAVTGGGLPVPCATVTVTLTPRYLTGAWGASLVVDGSAGIG